MERRTRKILTFVKRSTAFKIFRKLSLGAPENADMRFTKEIEENGKIPFLDCLVTRDNNKLKTTIYIRPITRAVFVQPDLSQGYYYPDSDETRTASLRLT